MKIDRKKIHKPIDFTMCKGVGDVYEVLSGRKGVDRARCIGDHLLTLRLGMDGGVRLSDKQFLLFMAIGMKCVYRHMAVYSRGDVMEIAGVGRSSYWSCLNALVECNLIVDSGLTFKDRKVNMVFVSPDYFYSGGDGRRNEDLGQWGLGNRTFGIEEK